MALSMEQCTLLSLVKLLIFNSHELAIMLIHSHADIHIVKYSSTLHMGRWLKRTVTVGCMWHEECGRRRLYFDLFSTLDAFMGGKGFTIFTHILSNGGEMQEVHQPPTKSYTEDN